MLKDNFAGIAFQFMRIIVQYLIAGWYVSCSLYICILVDYDKTAQKTYMIPEGMMLHV